MVSVLFVRSDSVYKQLGVDCWDIERNALNWPGGNPIVAHPPCRSWGTFEWRAKPRPGEKELAPWAIDQIRKHGGVLEHPRRSKLWKHMNLPLGSARDEWGGFSVVVDQSWFGHRAKKMTILYICGCGPQDLPKVPLKLGEAEYTIGDNRTGRPEISIKEREATPVEFAKWLIKVAEKCKSKILV